MRIALTALILMTACASADAATAYEIVPTSPEEQIRIFEAIAATNAYSVYETDEAGNITFVGFNGGHFPRSRDPDHVVIDHMAAHEAGELPGLGVEDLAKIRHFPELRGIAVTSMDLDSEAFSVLLAFPQLQLLHLNGVRTHDRVFTHLQGLDQLEVLDLTHSFGGSYDGEDYFAQLEGFPELRVLIIDKRLTNDFERLLGFLEGCPKLEFIKLHRCPFGDVEMRQIFDVLPELERLDMKPRGNTPGTNWSYQSLALLQDYPNLQHLRLIHSDALPLPWENGLEHLVDATNITHIEFPLKGRKGYRVDPDDLRRLIEARPDLNILELPEELEQELGIEDGNDRRWRLKSEMEVDTLGMDYGIAPG